MTAPLCCPLLVWFFLLLQMKLTADLCLFFCRMMNLSYLCFPLSAGGVVFSCSDPRHSQSFPGNFSSLTE